MDKFIDHLENTPYDKVILTRFEEYGLTSEYTPIEVWIDELYVYAYGWDENDRNTNPELEWVEGGGHSDYVIVEEWMKNLAKHQVYISGAFDGECIQDLEYALRGANVNFQRINDLIL